MIQRVRDDCVFKTLVLCGNKVLIDLWSRICVHTTESKLGQIVSNTNSR